MANPLVSITPQLIPQFMTSAGAPASGYLLQVWIAGTTTNQATYTDSTGATANTNPIVLNSNGNPQTGALVTCGIWLTQGLFYKFQLQTPTGTPVWTLDNVPATGPFQFYAGASTGSANAYAVANPQITSYATPFEVTFIANFANTGAATLNVNGLGTKNIYKNTLSGPAALTGTEIQTNQVVTVIYDGTEFQIVSAWPGLAYPTTHQQVFTTSGTFGPVSTTLPGTLYKFTVVGGGGGGAGANATGGSGGGGGAGATAVFFGSSLGTTSTVAVTIGAGGTAAAGSSGGNGGNSTIVFGATTVTGGGGAGATVSGSAVASAAGAGGTATNGTINISGGYASPGQPYLSTMIASGGTGGASTMGSGGSGGTASAGGGAANPYGSGGGGGGTAAGTNQTGGTGAIGIVIAEWTL